MADIRNFQSNYNTFNKNGFVDQVFTMTKLVYESEKRRNEHPDQPNFDTGYLPKMQYEDVNSFKDVFLYTKEKIFGIEGAQCVRFILLDKHGNIYENLESWTQVLPFSFLARVSCSYRNFDPSTLMLDYFVDMNSIQINNEAAFGSSTMSLINKDIIADHVERDGKAIKIDDRIADFNNYRNEIFIDFFKYDFGSAIKGLNLKN